MMPVELVQKIHQHSGHVTVDGGDLNLTASRPLPADLLDELRAHKAALLDYLNGKATNAISDADPPLDPAAEAGGRQVLTTLAANGVQTTVCYLTDPNTAKRQLKAMTGSGKILAIDTETCPKPGYEEDRKAARSPATAQFRLVQVTDGEKVLVLDMAHIPADVINILSKVRVVFHNAPFDLSFLLAAGVRLKEVSCTQLMIAALTHQPTISLAKACEVHLGAQIDKELQTSDWASPELSAEQIAYAARDALLTHALHERLVEKLKFDRLMHGFERVERCLP